MAKEKWMDAAGRRVYEAYPENEFLGMPVPVEGRKLATLRKQADKCGDPLFRFILGELEDCDACDGDQHFVERLDTAIRDIEEVKAAFMKKEEEVPKGVEQEVREWKVVHTHSTRVADTYRVAAASKAAAIAAVESGGMDQGSVFLVQTESVDNEMDDEEWEVKMR